LNEKSEVVKVTRLGCPERSGEPSSWEYEWRLSGMNQLDGTSGANEGTKKETNNF
jgi:hypothetical protein